MKVINSIKVGVTPSGIAFNKEYNYLIVTNRDANTVEIYDNNNKIAFVYFNITLIILITTWVIDVNSNYIYIIPLCIMPLLFKAFFDSRIAFFIHSVTVMLLGFVVPNSYEFIFLNIIAGVVTILTSDNIFNFIDEEIS